MFGSILLAATIASAAPVERPCMRSLPAPTMKDGAWGKAWYNNANEIEVFGRTYVKYGLPRVLLPGDVDLGERYMGVAIGLDPRAPNREVIYVFTAEPCEFQPYQIKPEPAPTTE